MRLTHVKGSGADPDMPTDERTATRVRLLHTIFESQSRVTPAVLALDVPPARPGMPRVRLTYAELDAAADLLAARLARTSTASASSPCSCRARAPGSSPPSSRS